MSLLIRTLYKHTEECLLARRLSLLHADAATKEIKHEPNVALGNEAARRDSMVRCMHCGGCKHNSGLTRCR